MLKILPKRTGGRLLTGAFVVLGLLSPLPAQEATIKIAVVDLEQVFVQSTAGKALQAKLEQFQKSVQAEMGILNDAANEIRRRATEGRDALSQDKLAELQKEYENKGIEIRRLGDDKRREGEKLKNEGLEEIQKKLEPVFKQIRDERGYDLILNNVPGIVVMASEKVDITRTVIERFNAMLASGG